MAYTIESSYKPFSFQELATPYMIYKDAYDKQETKLEELYDKASVFSDLDDLPEDSQARKIYDNYMNSLNAANKDFAANGLTMNNRGLYSDIRKRYQGEIGKLAQAKTKADELNKLRLNQRAQDSSMIFSQDADISIDDMLSKNKPNTYGISGKYLYDLGSRAGVTSSSRIWSNPEIKSTANKWFLLSSQANGYTPEMLARMRDDFMAIPEFRKQVENAMKANGVTDNLKGDKYTQAVLNYANGFIDSCTYKRNDSFQQNPSIEFNEKVREFNENKKMQEEQLRNQMQLKGFVKGDDGNYKYDHTQDAELQKATKIAEIKAAAAENKENNTTRKQYLEKPIIIKWHGRATSTSEVPYTTETVDGETIKTRKYIGSHQTFDDLKVWWKKRKILNTILNGIPQMVKDNPEDYDFYASSYKDDNNPETLTIVPHKIGLAATVQSGDTSSEDNSIASLH